MKQPLCKVDEIPDSGSKKVDFFGREVLVYKSGGKPRALVNTCLHLGGPLEKQGDKLVCAWHGAEYACHDGKHLAGPGRRQSRLMFLPTRVEAGVLTYVYGE